MSAAAKGPMKPKSAMRTARAEEMAASVQPKSAFRGRMRAPGSPMAPAVVSIVTKARATTTQP